ncbi:hypothetical protein K1719_036556 [Acacia pycnantha]|nr:hypothetical protein K1719_036556 [Acacia pycnantha]
MKELKRIKKPKHTSYSNISTVFSVFYKTSMSKTKLRSIWNTTKVKNLVRNNILCLPQSTSLKDQLIRSDRGQIQGDAKYQERIQVGSSFVSNWNDDDLQMIRYVFDCLRCLFLFALETRHTVMRQKIKLLIAMGKLFEKVPFTEFHLKMADNILLQPNGFDCGVFVINYMQQSDNYVKGESSFQSKEREDLAFRLLTNDLNQEKQNLYDKARELLYAQVDKQDGTKRSGDDDASETLIEAKYDCRVNRHDGLQKDVTLIEL